MNGAPSIFIEWLIYSVFCKRSGRLFSKKEAKACRLLWDRGTGLGPGAGLHVPSCTCDTRFAVCSFSGYLSLLLFSNGGTTVSPSKTVLSLSFLIEGPSSVTHGRRIRECFISCVEIVGTHAWRSAITQVGIVQRVEYGMHLYICVANLVQSELWTPTISPS